MTRTNVVLAVMVGILVFACFMLARELGLERDRVQALTAQLARKPSGANDPGRSPATENQAVSRDAPSVQSVAATPPSIPTSASGASAVKKAEAGQRHADHLRGMLADPAYRAAMRTQHRLQLEPHYGELAAELGLSQEEADRFLDLLADHDLRENENRIKNGIPGEGGNEEERRRRLKAQQEQMESERKAFLGEERYLAWTEYVNSAGARAQVRDLRTQLATSSSPLREDQIKPLVKALAAEDQRHAAERRENRSNGAQWTDETPAAERIAYMERRDRLIHESIDRTREAAASYLDSEQQKRFDAMLDQRRNRARADLELWRASIKAENK
jgi:hypothetical protein